MPLGFEQNGSGVHVPGKAFFILHMVQVIFPVQPVFEPFIGHGHPVCGRVMGPDNGTRTGGGTFTGIRQFIHTEGFVPHFGKLVSDGGANDTGTNDNCIIFLTHSLYLLFNF